MKSVFFCHSSLINNYTIDEVLRIYKKIKSESNNIYMFIFGCYEDIESNDFRDEILSVTGDKFRFFYLFNNDSFNSINCFFISYLLKKYSFSSIYFLENKSERFFDFLKYENKVINIEKNIVNSSEYELKEIESNIFDSIHMKDLPYIIQSSFPKLENDNLLKDVSKAFSQISTSFENKIYIDISTLIHFDHATGIQRVVNNIANQLMNNELLDCHLVYSYPEHTHFYNVKLKNGKYSPQDVDDLESNIIDFNDGDKFLFLDLHASNAYTKENIIKRLQDKGVSFYFVVYDLLPTSHPHYFVDELVSDFKRWLRTVSISNGALCISNDVRVKLEQWYIDNDITPSELFKTSFFHLGADFSKSNCCNYDISKYLPNELINQLESDTTSFLMVGTVEPRKGHSYVLQAFDELWKNGDDSILVIVGKAGWLNSKIIQHLSSHPQKDKKLFWLDKIDDDTLNYIYSNSSSLIAASEGEGFGLPLIEAAQKNIAIIARDISVFREVAQNGAFFFEDSSDYKKLSNSIKKWKELYKSNEHPKSRDISWITWNECSRQLIDLIR